MVKFQPPWNLSNESQRDQKDNETDSTSFEGNLN